MILQLSISDIVLMILMTFSSFGNYFPNSNKVVEQFKGILLLNPSGKLSIISKVIIQEFSADSEAVAAYRDHFERAVGSDEYFFIALLILGIASVIACI